MSCPRCHSTQIARSQRLRLSDIAMRFWNMKAFRCLDCRKRFHLPIEMAEGIRQRRERSRQIQKLNGKQQAVSSIRETIPASAAIIPAAIIDAQAS